MKNKKCVVCGKPLPGRQRCYCSEECKRKARHLDLQGIPMEKYIEYNDIEITPYTIRRCPVCGKSFKSKTTKVYCSDFCVKTAERLWQAGVPKEKFPYYEA